MPKLAITILSGEKSQERVEPEQDIVVVGRSETSTLCLEHARVSLEHCRFVVGPERVLLEDLESEHGTFVIRGDSRLNVANEPAHATELRHGDVVGLGPGGIGSCELAVSLSSDDEPPHVVAVRPLGELARDTASSTRNAELLKALAEVHAKLSATSDPADAHAVIADAALRLVPRATHATLVLKEALVPDASRDTDVFVPVLTRVRNEDGEGVAPPSPVAVTRSVFLKVVREHAAVLAVDAPSEAFSSESLVGANIKSTIGVPLWRNDSILGVLQVDNRDCPALFDTTDLDALGILATNASLTLDNARLIQRLLAAEQKLRRENQYLKDQGKSRREIVGQSPALSELMSQLKKVADTRVTVLIMGETGTGKELIAAALHGYSRRSQRLLVAQNCAAVPKDLLESELFGHRRGAFTGATEDKRGLFELADGGTLFLDEISELSLNLQAKLLRALQEREIRPLGAPREKQVDVRVVAASNRNLESEVRAGNFREDLYYRLNVFPLQVPPLRERKSDIPLLCQHFLGRYTREYAMPVAGFSDAALDRLAAYDWPGNVRELENEVQRLVIQSEPDTLIPVSLLSDRIRGSEPSSTSARPRGTLKQVMEQFERQIVSDTLERHQNNKTQAAKSLGITREGLHKKLKQLGID